MSPLLLRRLPDELLCSRLATGEAAAFDELFRRYSHRLAAYGSYLLGDAVAGEDVSQSALMKAFRVLRAGRAPRRLRPWLFQIARNTALDMAAKRREATADASSAEAPPRPDYSPAMLAGAVASLSGRQRDVFVLRELHGMPLEEIATRLALRIPQVEQALFAARNRLAEQLTFGDRLDCVGVRRLLSGPLSAEERRALKPHLRSCSGCRSHAGLRTRLGGLVPLDWLRLPLGGFLPGSAPLAAKATAVVATATFAAALPTAELRIDHSGNTSKVVQATSHPRTTQRGPRRTAWSTRSVRPPATKALAIHMPAPRAQPAPARTTRGAAKPTGTDPSAREQEVRSAGSGSDSGSRRDDASSGKTTPPAAGTDRTEGGSTPDNSNPAPVSSGSSDAAQSDPSGGGGDSALPSAGGSSGALPSDATVGGDSTSAGSTGDGTPNSPSSGASSDPSADGGSGSPDG